jgi:hypothetical protein
VTDEVQEEDFLNKRVNKEEKAKVTGNKER